MVKLDLVGLHEDISQGAQAGENGSTAEAHDRRTSPRRSAEDVSWIVGAKLNGGLGRGSAEVIDISSGGSLIQTDTRLTLGSTATLVLSGVENHVRARGRVIHSKVCSISTNGELSYRIAIQFDEMLAEPDGVDPHRSAVTTPREEVRPNGNETRAYPRANRTFEGSWEGASGKQAVRITDISERGCFVESMAYLPPGQRVHLKLVLPEAGELGFTGEVVNVDPNIGFGLRFVEMTAHQTTALKQTVWLSLNCGPTPTTVAATKPNSPGAAREDELAMVQIRNDW